MAIPLVVCIPALGPRTAATVENTNHTHHSCMYIIAAYNQVTPQCHKQVPRCSGRNTAVSWLPKENHIYVTGHQHWYRRDTATVSHYHGDISTAQQLTLDQYFWRLQAKHCAGATTSASIQYNAYRHYNLLNCMAKASKPLCAAAGWDTVHAARWAGSPAVLTYQGLLCWVLDLPNEQHVDNCPELPGCDISARLWVATPLMVTTAAQPCRQTAQAHSNCTFTRREHVPIKAGTLQRSVSDSAGPTRPPPLAAAAAGLVCQQAAGVCCWYLSS